MNAHERRWLMPILIGLTATLTVLSVAVGRVFLTWDVIAQQDAITRIILLELRIPRALLGVVVGAALGLAGAAMQAYLRNALAEPGTLGVSYTAALGAVMSIFFGIAGMHPWAPFSIVPLTRKPGRTWPSTDLLSLSGKVPSR